MNDYRQHGNCKDIKNPDIFFPDGHNVKALDYAIKMCEGCPVKTECLRDGLNDNLNWGVWGGILLPWSGGSASGRQKSRVARHKAIKYLNSLEGSQQ